MLNHNVRRNNSEIRVISLNYTIPTQLHMHTLSRGNNENDASTQTDLDKLLYSIEFCGPVEADMSASRDPCGIPRPTKEAGGRLPPRAS